ncbi:TetR/AcrR family transcriptional regulator [Geodermatophilus sp. URMC 63]
MSGRPAWAARTVREGRESETRSLLLSCAGRVFARLGYARTTVADITDEAEVSRATFYVYFASKDDVFRAVALGVRDRFLAAHELPDVDADDPYELAYRSSDAYLRAAVDHRELLTVIEHQGLADQEIAQIWRELRERPLQRTARYITRVTAEGLASPAAEARAIAEAVYGMFMHFAHLVAAHPDEYDRAVEQLTAMYLRLLGVRERAVLATEVAAGRPLVDQGPPGVAR